MSNCNNYACSNLDLSIENCLGIIIRRNTLINGDWPESIAGELGSHYYPVLYRQCYPYLLGTIWSSERLKLSFDVMLLVGC